MYRVLIADDEELELKAMHFFMERNYPEAMLLPDAQDGTQVVEIVTRENPELLILDIEMPGLNGLQALSILRERGYKGHVIVHLCKRCTALACGCLFVKTSQKK